MPAEQKEVTLHHLEACGEFPEDVEQAQLREDPEYYSRG